MSPVTGQRHFPSRQSIKSLLVTVASLMLLACAPDTPAERFERAQELYQQGDYRTASIEVRNVLQQEPDNLEARLLFGRISLVTGDLETAAHELSRAAQLGAAPEIYAVDLGSALARLGRADEAAEALERLDEGARGSDWWTARGELYLSRTQPAEARQAFNRAIDLADGDAAYRPLVGLVRVAAAQTNNDEALELADRAIAMLPDLPDAWLARGNVQLALSNFAAAEQDLARAAELMTAGPVSQQELNNLFVLGELQFTLRRTEPLARTAAIARQRAPDTPVTHYLEGAVHYINERHRDADISLQRALAITEVNPRVRLLLGLNSLAMRNLGLAEQHLLAALELMPGNVAVTRLLAEARRQQGRPGAALERVQQLPGADSDATLIALRGVLNLEANQPQQAIVLLERAMQTLPGDTGLQLQLARAYMAGGRRDDAARLFESSLGAGADRVLETAVALLSSADDADEMRAEARAMLAAQPDDTDVRAGVALFLFAIGDRREARAELERVIERDPENVSAHLALAGLALADGEADEAHTLYEAVTTRSPDDYRAWLGLARLAALDQASDEALSLANRAAEVAPQEVLPHLFMAQVHMEGGDLQAAEAALARARTIAPGNGDVLTLTGALELRKQRPQQALSPLREAAESDPLRADRWYTLARAQRAGDDLVGAAESLRRALQIAPRSLPVRMELAQVEHLAGNEEEARAMARALQAEFPDNAEGYLLEGAFLAEIGNYTRASTLFEQGYSLRPTFEAAQAVYRARSLGDMDNPGQLLERWLESEPDDVRALLLLAESRHTRGRESDALVAYRRILELEPGNVLALNNAAWLMGQAGDPQAVDYARRAHEQAPQSVAVMDTYGWLLVQSGDVETGLPLLRQAAAGAPDSADIQYHFAYGLAQAGQREESRALLQRLLADDSDFTYREQAEALLAEL